MKDVLLKTLKILWGIIRVILTVAGTIGSYLFSGILLISLLCYGLIWLVFGWDYAFELMFLPVLAILGIFFGCVTARVIGTFQPED